jgi:hypothetical protein
MLHRLVMDVLRLIHARHPHAVQWAWLALILVLAACNTGGDSGGSGGGGGGY